jgi:glutamate dehydrogenase (NAD(P)+)
VAQSARCAVIAPGANVPYAPGSVEILRDRGIVAVPDFIANSGGVHLYLSVDETAAPEAALATIEGIIRDAVTRTLTTAGELGVTPFAGALRQARAYLAEASDAPPEARDELFAGP